MRVLMASAELWPLAKVGGLGDATGALADALVRAGHDVRCAVPGYDVVAASMPQRVRETGERRIPLSIAGRIEEMTVTAVSGGGLPGTVLLVGHESFDRPGIYEDPETGLPWPDNGTRWALFCRAVWASLGADGWIPDVVHAHDHQAALLPALARWGARPTGLVTRVPTVYTIHNLGYQGIEPSSWIEDSGLPPSLAFPTGPLEYHGEVNLMKLGIESADLLTTVSPRYADEIRTIPEFGAGLDGVLSARGPDLVGILNGIDTVVWNPARDPHLVAPYSASRFSGKAKNTTALRAEVGLDDPGEARVPLAGSVTRLASQKGIDLLLAVLDRVVADGVQLVVLGAGEPALEAALREAAARHPGKVAVRVGFDEGLAHRIEAGADLFLMPSRYEPCGLNQMYSLRYGTVPIVRAVGGLADTVVDLDEDPESANGFAFRAWEPVELLKTIRRAVRAWKDRRLWRSLVRRGMASDFSWDRAAARYVEAYRRAGGSSRG